MNVIDLYMSSCGEDDILSRLESYGVSDGKVWVYRKFNCAQCTSPSINNVSTPHAPARVHQAKAFHMKLTSFGLAPCASVSVLPYALMDPHVFHCVLSVPACPL